MLVCATIVTACGLGGGMAGVSSMSCSGVPSGACEEQARILTAGLTGATDISIACRPAPPCTRAGGAGTAEIRLQNGQTVNRTWSYVGDPGPGPAVTCLGIERPLCLEYVQSEIDGVPPSKHIASVDATCTSTTCTRASGEMQLTITLGDGSRQQSTTGWSSGP